MGWDRPFVWQLRRGGSGPQDAGLFTVGSPGPSKPPCGTGRLFTQQGKKELRPGPGLLPAQNEEGRSVLRPAASWGSDGNFILPCILERERWGQLLEWDEGGGSSRMGEATRKGKAPGLILK